MTPLHYRFWPKDLPTHLTYPRTSLYYNLEVSATRYPYKRFLIYYDTPLTFSATRTQVDALAGYLQQRCGVKRGDRVLLFMQNCPQFMLAFYAILRADAMVVPVNPMNLTEELSHYVTDADASVIITAQELYPQVKPLLGDGGLRHVLLAAYSDYVTQPTDLALPDAVRAPRQHIAEPGVTLWAEALSAGLAPGPHLAGPD